VRSRLTTCRDFEKKKLFGPNPSLWSIVTDNGLTDLAAASVQDVSHFSNGRFTPSNPVYWCQSRSFQEGKHHEIHIAPAQTTVYTAHIVV